MVKRKKKPSKKLTAHEPPVHLSEVLEQLANDTSREKISVADLLTAMHHRALAALMFIFAAPNILPTPPGLSTIFSIPLIFLSVQLTLGMNPWLPKVMSKRRMPRRNFQKMVKQINPWLIKAERFIKPRASWLTTPPVEFLLGALCLSMAIIIFFPIPFGNLLPAVSICLFSLAIMGRDGLWVFGGLLFAGLSVLVVGGVVYGIIKAIIFFVEQVLNGHFPS